ncbi:MAG TPA: hypothetical protein PK659_09245 [Methanothrix sp.]|nr:hypothetical protein [Methanothrix sp.]HOK59192.1 hypothetical protein [Methanothrix sp.]HOL44423.1 hypothetical protein [Methanothrix sp.]HPO89351.1 hypothetical protein [Methanothrix sp.]
MGRVMRVIYMARKKEDKKVRMKMRLIDFYRRGYISQERYIELASEKKKAGLDPVNTIIELEV